MKTNWREMAHTIELHVNIVLDAFNCCCIHHNLMIRRGAMELANLMRRMALEAESKMRLRLTGLWGLIDDEIRRSDTNLEEGEVCREEQQMNGCYHLAVVQPQRR